MHAHKYPVPAVLVEGINLSNPFSQHFSIAAPACPTPGKITLSALRIIASSSVTTDYAQPV